MPYPYAPDLHLDFENAEISVHTDRNEIHIEFDRPDIEVSDEVSGD